ncbi:MFS transporter [Anaerobacillus sp. CMMVII]|uniref:MFS transporter n=1 Tax=Anaerobacillus sp. CMMVII TaxID=2755588 RepID=UPI0021B81721|nr:MFS transporter [Anaerobacillus sp. CMMVII]
MKVSGLSPALLVLAIVLGEKFESYFRRAIIVSKGDMTAFFTSGISMTLISVALAFVLYDIFKTVRAKKKKYKKLINNQLFFQLEEGTIMKLLWIVMICQAVYSIIIRGSRPIISLYADNIGASPFFIGLLAAAFAFLPMLFAISVGKWLDKQGAKKMTMIGSIGMLLSFILPVLYPTLFSLLFNQLLIGISHLCILISLQKTVGNIVGDRDRLIAAFSLSGAFGEFVGAILTGYLFEMTGFRWTFLIMILFIIVGLVFTRLMPNMVKKEQKKLVDKKAEKTWKMLKNVNLRKALIVSGLVLFSKDLVVAYFPVYGNSIGLSPSQIGLVIGLLSAMSMIIRFLQSELVHTIGRARLMVLLLVVSGISFILIPTTSSLLLLILISLVLGAGLGLGQPLSLVYTLNVTPETGKVKY